MEIMQCTQSIKGRSRNRRCCRYHKNWRSAPPPTSPSRLVRRRHLFSFSTLVVNNEKLNVVKSEAKPKTIRIFRNFTWRKNLHHRSRHCFVFSNFVFMEKYNVFTNLANNQEKIYTRTKQVVYVGNKLNSHMAAISMFRCREVMQKKSFIG